MDLNKIKIGYDEVNKVVLEMFESKIVKIVKKLPRSHIILLEQLWYFEMGGIDTLEDSSFVWNDFNALVVLEDALDLLFEFLS